jgi:exoribonuclease-2
MAALALGADEAAERSALLRALIADAFFFERKASGWIARSEQKVEEARQRVAAEEKRARRETAFTEGVREALEGSPPGEAFLEEHAATLTALEGLVLVGTTYPGAEQAVKLLPNRPPGGPDDLREAVFGVLAAVGIYEEDEDLGRRRIGIPDTFPAEVEAAAREAAERGPLPDGREDLRDLELWAIDEATTREVDDAVGLAGPGPEPGTWILAIAVADPAAYIRPDDTVDREALGRALAHFLPTGVLPMLPDCLAQEAASLADGKARPAVVFFCTLSEEGDLSGFRACLATVEKVQRITYLEATERIEAGEGPLARLDALVQARLRKRHEGGAVILRQPEIEIRVEDGKIDLHRSEPGSPGRVLVSELMVLAGEAAARWLVEKGAPSLFRRQPASEDLPPEAKDPAILEADYDPVLVRSIRRLMRPSEVRTEPGPHFGLGLEAYCQVTSPLRRYQDLTVHRQIRALLLGEEPPYDAEDLQRIAATTEAAEQTMRKAERQSREFWFLRYLEGHVGEEVEAVVVDVRPRRVLAELVPYLRQVALSPREHHQIGAKITVRITVVRPRAGVVRVEEIL